MRLTLSALAVALAATPASAYLAKNDKIVRDIDGVRFEVLQRGGLGASEAWCAAGDYALRFLGLPPTTRIWRISPPPRRQGEGITFALTSEGTAGRTGLVQLAGDDGSLSAAHAEQLCLDPIVVD